MNRIDQSVANLLSIIKEQDNQLKTFQLLADLMVPLIKERNALEGTSLVATQDLEDLIDHLQEYDLDYLILLIPGKLPEAYDREQIDKAREAGTLAIWIREKWQEETIALAV